MERWQSIVKNWLSLLLENAVHLKTNSTRGETRSKERPKRVMNELMEKMGKKRLRKMTMRESLSMKMGPTSPSTHLMDEMRLNLIDREET